MPSRTTFTQLYNPTAVFQDSSFGLGNRDRNPTSLGNTWIRFRVEPMPCRADVEVQTNGHVIYVHCRQKFRSQTSDNMDRWKSKGGKSQRREKQ